MSSRYDKNNVLLYSYNQIYSLKKLFQEDDYYKKKIIKIWILSFVKFVSTIASDRTRRTIILVAWIFLRSRVHSTTTALPRSKLHAKRSQSAPNKHATIKTSHHTNVGFAKGLHPLILSHSSHPSSLFFLIH